jgi:hypothetical protein
MALVEEMKSEMYFTGSSSSSESTPVLLELAEKFSVVPFSGEGQSSYAVPKRISLKLISSKKSYYLILSMPPEILPSHSSGSFFRRPLRRVLAEVLNHLGNFTSST